MPLAWMFNFYCACIIASPVWAQTNLIDRIQKADKSIVEVQTQLTKVIKAPNVKKPKGHQQVATFERRGVGIIIDALGIIVTNSHTVVNAPFIVVTLHDGTILPARIIFASHNNDFSFLKVNPQRPLNAIAWANSDQASLGQPIIAIGNSDFNNQSILSGEIKSLLRSHASGTNEYLELNLDLYHGDSGGPILNRQGQLLGIIMAKRRSTKHSSLAIAANKIREQYWQYKRNMP